MLFQNINEKNLARKKASAISDKKRYAISDIKEIMPEEYFKRPDDKCIGYYRYFYVEWVSADYDISGWSTSISYCPEFEKEQGCSNTSCPTYKKYCEYRKAQEDYEKAKRESVVYPLWLMLRWILKREK